MKEHKIFFTADTHFNHVNIIKYCNRPFKNVKEMNETLINNWNIKVPSGGLVYHLGDFGIGVGKGYGVVGLEEIIKQLNGQIFLVQGSHDKPALKLKKYFVKIMPLHRIVIEDIYITLCHYCMRTWEKSHFNSWHLYGHSHGRLKPSGKSWDVGVDTNKYTPLSFNEITSIMKKRPDNFNLVKGE